MAGTDHPTGHELGPAPAPGVLGRDSCWASLPQVAGELSPAPLPFRVRGHRPLFCPQLVAVIGGGTAGGTRSILGGRKEVVWTASRLSLEIRGPCSLSSRWKCRVGRHEILFLYPSLWLLWKKANAVGCTDSGTGRWAAVPGPETTAPLSGLPQPLTLTFRSGWRRDQRADGRPSVCPAAARLCAPPAEREARPACGHPAPPQVGGQGPASPCGEEEPRWNMSSRRTSLGPDTETSHANPLPRAWQGSPTSLPSPPQPS